MTFICGRAGVCALGAVVAKHAGDEMLLNHYLSSFREVRLGTYPKFYITATRSSLPCDQTVLASNNSP